MTDAFNNGNFAGSFAGNFAGGTNGFGGNGFAGNGNSFGSGSSFGSNNTNSNRYSWSSGYSTTPTTQTRTPTPWSPTAVPTYTTQTPWQNNQTLTPWNGGYDLNSYEQNNGNSKSIDYSLYGDGFSKEFIDRMLNDSRFQQIMRNRTQRNEGGYSNHPNDKGGKTMYGINSKWYPNEDIENLTRERANAILYRDYWLKPHINQLPDEFADIVFDDGVVQGQPTAIINLQRALGIQADGIIGPNTLSAFENANYGTVRRNFIRNVNNVEDKYLQNDPSQKVFERGHRDRFKKY